MAGVGIGAYAQAAGPLSWLDDLGCAFFCDVLMGGSSTTANTLDPFVAPSHGAWSGSCFAGAGSGDHDLDMCQQVVTRNRAPCESVLSAKALGPGWPPTVCMSPTIGADHGRLAVYDDGATVCQCPLGTRLNSARRVSPFWSVFIGEGPVLNREIALAIRCCARRRASCVLPHHLGLARVSTGTAHYRTRTCTIGPRQCRSVSSKRVWAERWAAVVQGAPLKRYCPYSQ